MSAAPTTITHRPPRQAVIVAVVLPFAMVAACAVARLVWPSMFGDIVSFGTLCGAGVLGYLLGSWLLFRALRLARARWVISLVAYDLAMPLAIFGLVVLIEASRVGL